MTQGGAKWGGTQGNDTTVTLTIEFTDTTTTSFTGVLNWQLNDGGNAIPVTYFGVTTATVVPDATDRYTRTSNTFKKTYILVLPSKVASSGFASLITSDGTDGSANFNEAAIFQALNTEFASSIVNTAPAFTGTNATDANSAPSYSFSYPEKSATGATLATITASDADGDTLTYSITGGNANGWYAIDPATGVITLTAAGAASLANDFNQNPNSQTLTVAVSDGAAVTTIEVKLNETDTPPVMTGPSGGTGAANSALSVNEGQTAVTKVTANETVTWSITGGNEAGKFQIAADGTITFLAAPDYDHPTDSDTDNTYVLTVTATDTSGNITTQTITVTVLNVDTAAPLITGPSGGQGAAASALTINEGLTAVTTFTANETVTWSIDGGSDAGKFQIAANGAITFLAAPDFENPTDSDHNNTYVVRVKAVDGAGNVSYQTLTVTIISVDEIARKLDQIGSKLRTGLRKYAVHGLSDMLSFNESLMRDGNDDAGCSTAKARKDLSGAVRANETGTSAELNYSKQLNECGRRYKVLADLGMTYSRLGGNWNTRLLGALRFEARLNTDLTVGAGVMASRSSDQLSGFVGSSISDHSLQFNLYSRYRLSEKLRTGAFVGIGRTWYDFGLTESDGFVMNGTMTGKRHLYGWMLSGDVNVGDTVVTADAVISRAVEKLGSASLAARYMGENRSNIAFAVGTVDVTRISVPVSAPIQLTGSADGYGSSSRLLISPGLLCEDNNVDSSALRCGYQLGAKLVANDGGRNKLYADYRWESVGGNRRSLMSIGYAYRLGSKNGMELAVEMNRGLTGLMAQDNRAMLSFRVAK